ncbi:MAG: hypothetical protein ACLRMJ_03875 [Alistipes finegoldii]
MRGLADGRSPRALRRRLHVPTGHCDDVIRRRGRSRPAHLANADTTTLRDVSLPALQRPVRGGFADLIVRTRTRSTRRTVRDGHSRTYPAAISREAASTAAAYGSTVRATTL